MDSIDDPKECYDRANKASCVIISNFDCIGFILSDAHELSSEVLCEFMDITIASSDFSWTYCKTHEEMCGPYFYKNTNS